VTCDYSKPETPPNYVCTVCGANNVKLWREYMTCADYVHLHCARCAALESKEDISDINADGMRTGKYSRTDQIGSYVPAVPTDMGGSYWGYTSVSNDAVLWWKNLPTLSIPTIPIST
jgi:hypothetical protein